MKMKLIAIALSGIVLSGAAAADFDPKFYVGGEAQYNKAKTNKSNKDIDLKDEKGKSILKENTPGAGVFVGSRLHENFGVEAGYSHLKNAKKTFADKSSNTNKMNNVYADALGYLPVSCDVDLIGSVGVGRLSTKLSSKDENGVNSPLTSEGKKASKAKAGVRVGLGAQYMFCDNVGARVMLRHQKGNKVVKNVNSANLGLFYQF